MDSDSQLVFSKFPIGVQMGSDQETYLDHLDDPSMDHCHVGKLHDDQGHGVIVASSLSVHL